MEEQQPVDHVFGQDPAQSPSEQEPGANPEQAKVSDPGSPLPRVLQVRLKAVDQKLHLFLPAIAPINHLLLPDWSEILAQLEQRLSSGSRFWSPNTPVDLQAGDRLLDANQLEDLAESLNSHGLKLVKVNTQRRQTAIAAAASGFNVEQQLDFAPLTQVETTSTPILEEPLYLTMTVRSGTEINHPGTVIIAGDVNAGAEITAAADIIVWGKLRGKAHAGSQGNRSAKIMALQMSATQLRIADCIARVESSGHTAEVAKVINDQICLMPVS